jgi:hypothetical protein
MDRTKEIAQARLAKLSEEMHALVDGVKRAGRSELTRSERERFAALDSEFVALAIENYVGADEKKNEKGREL